MPAGILHKCIRLMMIYSFISRFYFSDFTDFPTNQIQVKLLHLYKLNYPMKNLVYIFAALLFLIVTESCQDRPGKNYNKENQEFDGAKFIKDGIEGSMTEIKASGLAITNS